VTLYFAYGSNLNQRQMAVRCPAAIPLFKFALPDNRLVFRGVADCIVEAGASCPGAVWLITRECERALDRYEGFRPAGDGMYRKDILPIEPFEGETGLMLYRMNSTGIFPPSEGYLASIREGYRDFKIATRPLHAAVRAAWDDKHPSHVERQRHRRNGRPALAPKNSANRE
jgi:hypothetical protein